MSLDSVWPGLKEKKTREGDMMQFIEKLYVYDELDTSNEPLNTRSKTV